MITRMAVFRKIPTTSQAILSSEQATFCKIIHIRTAQISNQKGERIETNKETSAKILKIQDSDNLVDISTPIKEF